jgi:hypothetical protein
MSVWLGAHWGRLALVAVWVVLIWDTPRRAWYCMVVIAAGLALFVLAGLTLVPVWLDVPALALGLGGRVWAARITRGRPATEIVETMAIAPELDAGPVDL